MRTFSPSREDGGKREMPLFAEDTEVTEIIQRHVLHAFINLCDLGDLSVLCVEK
jgi:hypothetical protein